MTHIHTCANASCRFVWKCLEPKSETKCPVMVAARVNKTGPFCDLCLHLEMAKRHAEARGLLMDVTLATKPERILAGAGRSQWEESD